MDSNFDVGEIPETFSAIRLGVEVKKFHVVSSVYHFKCFRR